mgnify:CR=1 FL=1
MCSSPSTSAVAAAVTQGLNQTFATPFQDLLQGIAAVHNTMQNAAQAQPIVHHTHSQPVTQHFHNDNRQVALVDARQGLQQILQQDNRYVQLFQANQTNVAQVDASQNLQRMNVDASQNVLNMEQTAQQVNITPVQINVALTAFVVNHRQEINEYMQQNNVNFEVAVEHLFNVYHPDFFHQGGGGGGGGWGRTTTEKRGDTEGSRRWPASNRTGRPCGWRSGLKPGQIGRAHV